MSKQALEWLRAEPAADGIRSPSQWAILKELAWKYDEKRGYAWPGVSRLSGETRFARSTVQAALAELERLGWITRVTVPGSSNRFVLPRYRDNEAELVGARQPGTQPEVHGPEGARQPGNREPHDEANGAREPGGDARQPGGVAREPDDRVPGCRAQQVVETQGMRGTQVKPLRGDPTIDSPIGTATAPQLTFLADIYLMQSGHRVTDDVRAEWAALTTAQADDEIRRGWATLEAERPQAIRERIPSPYRAALSPQAVRWLTQAEAAA